MSLVEPIALVMLPLALIWNRVGVKHADDLYRRRFFNSTEEMRELGVAYCAFLKALAYGFAFLTVIFGLTVAFTGQAPREFIFLAGALPAGVIGLTLFVRFNQEYSKLE